MSKLVCLAIIGMVLLAGCNIGKEASLTLEIDAISGEVCNDKCDDACEAEGLSSLSSSFVRTPTSSSCTCGCV